MIKTELSKSQNFKSFFHSIDLPNSNLALSNSFFIAWIIAQVAELVDALD